MYPVIWNVKFIKLNQLKMKNLRMVSVWNAKIFWNICCVALKMQHVKYKEPLQNIVAFSSVVQSFQTRCTVDTFLSILLVISWVLSLTDEVLETCFYQYVLVYMWWHPRSLYLRLSILSITIFSMVRWMFHLSIQRWPYF